MRRQKHLHQFEVVETAEELSLGNQSLLILLVVEFQLCNLFDGDVALGDTLVAILPEVLYSITQVDGVAGKHGCCSIFTRVLCGVTHPAIIGGNVAEVVEFVNLPPVITCDEVVATGNLLFTFFLGGEVVLHILLTADRLLKEVGARCQAHSQGRSQGQTYDISFHNLVSYFNDYIYYNNVYSLRLEAHVQTEEEGTWVRITCVVDTCLCYTFTH